MVETAPKASLSEESSPDRSPVRSGDPDFHPIGGCRVALGAGEEVPCERADLRGQLFRRLLVSSPVPFPCGVPIHVKSVLSIPGLLLVVFAAAVLGLGGPVPAEGVPVGSAWDADGGAWPASLAKRAAAQTARWLFYPDDTAQALSQLGQQSLVARKGVLGRFGGAWILQAPADRAGEVERQWAPLGRLVRDRSGTPALSRTTSLVGVRPRVWDRLDMEGDPGSSVAILDSGCDTAHDDLGDLDFDNFDAPPDHAGDADDWRDAAGGISPDPAFRVIGWMDVTDDVAGSDGPYDYHYHGTALAGVAFASGRHRSDYRGVAPAGRLVVVKTYNYEGRWEVWASDLLLGIDWVLDHARSHHIHACLIGAVWDQELGMTAAIDSLLDAGIAVIAPAGNDPSGVMGWPARIPGVITVGATDADGRVAAYNTPAVASDLRPDFLAPGGGSEPVNGPIVTCDNEPDDTYRGRVGTSIAAAHVAGAVSLVSQALRESGRPWRWNRSQVGWLQGLLRACALETQAAEPGAPSPTLDRGGWDPVEGFGLLQIDAAVDAVRRSLWPGDKASFTLGSPLTGSAVWAARMPLLGGTRIQLELTVPADADFDLMFYRERSDGVDRYAASTSATMGTTEVLDLSAVPAGHYLVVVKRIAGEGQARLKTRVVFQASTNWPVLLSAKAVNEPMPFDVDGDGSQEVFLSYNVAILDSGHLVSMNRADGSAVPPFPRDFFTGSSHQGELIGPAVADLGAGPWIVNASQFGAVYAMDLAGQLPVQLDLTPNLHLTAPAIWSAGPDAAIVVGTQEGFALVDSSGTVADRWLLGGAARGPAALGDLDGDGSEEIVMAAAATLHARRRAGTSLGGWPVVPDPQGELSAPVIVVEGGIPAVYVCARRADGSARLFGYEANGAPRPGFPVSLIEDGQILAVSGLSASRLETSQVSLFVAVLVMRSDGRLIARVHQLPTDGGDLPWPAVQLGGAALAGTSFQLSHLDLSSVRVGDVLPGGGPEVFFALQVSWEELQASLRWRWGSVRRVIGYTGGQADERLQWNLADAHPVDEAIGQTLPVRSWKLAPVISDLDGDGRSELLMARGVRVYLQEGEVATSSGPYWSVPRNGPRRTGCFGCAPAAKVARPAGPKILKLRSYPNPFNPQTEIELVATAPGLAHFALYDARGRRLLDWTRRIDRAGTFREILHGVDRGGVALASGVYRLVVELNGERQSQAITLVR